MPSWKKVIISGSNAALNSLTVTNGITGSLYGTSSWAVSSSYALTSSYSLNPTISGSISLVDYIDFNTSASYTLATGRLGWDNGEGGLQLGMAGGNVQYALGEQLMQYCYNAESTTLTKGQVVLISGSQGNRIAVKLADNSADSLSAGTLGFVGETITAGGNGWVITEGNLRKLNTIGLTPGALLYLGSTPGTYTETVPIAPRHTVRLGYVERVHATVGSIYVKIDNGYEIGELHDVRDTTTTSSFGDLLVKSGSVWTNSRQLTGSYGLTGSLNATSFTGSFSGSHFGPLIGTASYASQALSASYSITSSNALTASFVTGSNVYGPFGSNSILSASFAISSSRTVTSSFAISSSNALTASFVLSSSYAVSSSNALTSSFLSSGTNAFIQNGNSFGTTALLGTNDNQSLALETNGTTRMFISSSGNVGIGTSTPGGRLHVVGTSPSVFVDTSNTFAVSIGAASASPNIVAIGTSGTGLPQIQGYTAGFGATASLTLQPNGGSVGVGTTTTPFSRLTTLGALSTTTSQMSIVNSEGGHTILRTGIASISNSGFSLISADVDGTNQNTRLVISSAGNVGIGTTTPNSGSLHVNGNVFATSYTGSLFGTASWANNATTASFVTTAQTASFVTGSNVFGPFGSNSIISASFAVSSSRAVSSSFASTASLVSSIAPNIISNTNNYVLTATGGSSIQGESTLTFDGTLLTAPGALLQGGANSATGTGAHAEGRATDAVGERSHAEGADTLASGSYSHAEGRNTVAKGIGSHAEGRYTLALGENSHAEGYFTTASADYSHAAGLYSVSFGKYQSVIGQYNLSSSADSAFIIGNGTGLDASRSNLVFASGSQFQITGSLNVTGSSIVVGSLTVGSSSLGPSENTVTLGARDSGGEGGQLGFNASGGTYTSASMLDNYQNRFRLLRGTNAGSDAEVAWWSMHNKQMALPAYNSVSAFSGTATALLAVDTSGNVITVATGSGGGGSGTVTQVNTAGTVNGITLTGGPITTTGTITLGGTLSGIANSQLTNSSLMIGNSSISLGATASSLTGLTSVTATSFTGSLQGTSSWANNATNAVNVGVTDNPSSGGGPFYIPFVAASTGNAAIQVDSSTFLYAPSTNTITVTNLAGTASWATNVTTAQTASFVTGSNVFGPFGSNSIRSASFAVSSSYAEAAKTVGITLQDTTPVTYNVTFTGGSSGNQSLNVDTTTLTYNPSTTTLAVTNLAGTASWATNATSATTATSANTLTNTRTIWGQNFNGSANVTGNLTSVGTISGSAGVDLEIFSAPNTRITLMNPGADSVRFGTSNTVRWSVDGSTGNLTSVGAQTIATTTGNLTLATNAGNGNILLTPNGTGKVGIGTTNPNFLLDVSGSANITGSLNIGISTITTARSASSAAGANTLFTQATGSFTAAKYFYTVTSASNARTGEVMAVWNGTSVQYTDNSTLDIGSTTAVTASVSIVTAQAQFNMQTTNAGWTIKSQVTYL